MRAIVGAGAVLISLGLGTPGARAKRDAEEARKIAKEATIYGFPMVDSYRIQYSYFVDEGGSEFKAPWNTMFNNSVCEGIFKPSEPAKALSLIEQGLVQSIAEIEPDERPVLIVGNMPGPGFPVAECVAVRETLWRRQCSRFTEFFTNPPRPAEEILKRVSQKEDHIYFLDSMKEMCTPPQGCPIRVANEIIYRDSSHLRYDLSPATRQELVDRLDLGEAVAEAMQGAHATRQRRCGDLIFRRAPSDYFVGSTTNAASRRAGSGETVIVNISLPSRGGARADERTLFSMRSKHDYAAANAAGLAGCHACMEDLRAGCRDPGTRCYLGFRLARRTLACAALALA